MKKLLLLILTLILTISSFADSELDSLLKDDEDIFSELTTADGGLETKDVFVEELVGQAFLQHEESDKWLQIVEETKIKEKDTIITMENSAMKVRMEDETYINVGERTKLYFDTLRGKPEEEQISETGLKLAWGKVFSKVRKRVEIGGKYEIEAGSVVAGVRGTEYTVEAVKQNGDKDVAVSVKVFDGIVAVDPIDKIRETADADVEIESKDKGVILTAGEQTSVDISTEGAVEFKNTIHNDSAPSTLDDMNTNRDMTSGLPDIPTKGSDISLEDTLGDVESDAEDTMNERGSTGGPAGQVFENAEPR